jgi:hypothetical protein
MRQGQLDGPPMPVFAKNFLRTPPGIPKVSLAMSSPECISLAAENLRASGSLRFRVRGESMLPTLWPRSVVEIARCTLNDVKSGDIVLAFHKDRFVLHRLLKHLPSGGFLLRGDSMPGADPEFPPEALRGRLVRCSELDSDWEDRRIEAGESRGAKSLRLRPWTRAVGKLLCHCAPARHLALKLHASRTVMRNPNSLDSQVHLFASVESGQR